MHSFRGHVTMAVRMLRQRPGLTAARALTVTLVVTATTAIFTVVNATLLRPLPFPQVDRLLRVYMQPPGTDAFSDANPLAPHVFRELRDGTRAFEMFEGIWVEARALTGDGEPDSVRGGRVSAGFLTLLGGAPAIGRGFTEQEVEEGAKLVVLGHGLWMRRFGGDRAVLGRAIRIDRDPFVVIGIAPASFEPIFTGTELWTPLTLRRDTPIQALTAVQTTARLAPGVSAAQAHEELARALAGLVDATPAMLRGWRMGVIDLREAGFGSRRAALLMLLAAAGALALIAMGNLANLTLADVTARIDAFALRAALGASRLDMAAPELVQSLIVALGGAAAGLTLATWLTPPLIALDPSTASQGIAISTDWRVVLCGIGVSMLVMMCAVGVPVLRAGGPALAAGILGAGRRSIGRRGASRTRLLLVGTQTALALVLLSSGAVIVAGFQRAARTDPGFDPSHLITGQLQLPAAVYPAVSDRVAFIDRVLAEIRATHGVAQASTTLNRFTFGNAYVTLVHIEDRPAPGGEPHTVQYRRISSGYFDTMRVRRIAGRDFDSRDREGGQPVAIVSESFARRFWPDRDPIGRRLRRGATATEWSVVVGVVADVHDGGIDQTPLDTVYTPFAQGNSAAAPIGLVVRTMGEPGPFLPAIKRAIWKVDPAQPLANVVTADRHLTTSLGQQRFRALVIAICGAMGLLLATIGTYGVTARVVVERTREVGIRVALGGRPLAVWWAVARSSLQAVIAGALVGMAGASLSSAALAALVPGVSRGGWTIAFAAAVLLPAGGLAAFAAARRATTIDPVRALAE